MSLSSSISWLAKRLVKPFIHSHRIQLHFPFSSLVRSRALVQPGALIQSLPSHRDWPSLGSDPRRRPVRRTHLWHACRSGLNWMSLATTLITAFPPRCWPASEQLEPTSSLARPAWSQRYLAARLELPNGSRPLIGIQANAEALSGMSSTRSASRLGDMIFSTNNDGVPLESQLGLILSTRLASSFAVQVRRLWAHLQRTTAPSGSINY